MDTPILKWYKDEVLALTSSISESASMGFLDACS